MSLKPWYKVVTPREDLREGKPLDVSEFVVHQKGVTSQNLNKILAAFRELGLKDDIQEV